MDAGDPVVYCLATVEEPIVTYIGATIDKERRLRQHNGLIVGGARATGRRPLNWYRVCYVRGFTSWNTALSFEWHWKYYSRKCLGSPLDKRMKGLDACLEWAASRMDAEGLEVVYE
jgi:predicted GIY-YIG superfamily endonuclease